MEYVNAKLDVLADLLIDVIKNRKDFFRPLTIVVPSQKTAQWFKTYWLLKENDVLMNVQFKSIDEALLSSINNPTISRIIKEDELKLIVIKTLFEDKGRFTDISSFIEQDVRLYDLAGEMAKLFIDYDNDCIDITGWQKDLYDKVFEEAEKNYASTLRRMFEKRAGMNIENHLYLFGFIEFTVAQKNVLNELNGHYDSYMLKKEEETNVLATIISAPSMLREVEAVHSQICKLIKDNADVTYKDFLVVAPSINEYDSIIKRVFKQDNKEFPSIPFSISDRIGIVTDVSSGMNKLFEIYNQGFFTRNDFYELINNKTIQNVRGITEEDVENWANSIVSMNVYRNKDNGDDWKYAKRRLLLSKVVDPNDEDENIVDISNDSYIPFSTIGLDNDSIVRFVKLVDDLNSWIDVTRVVKTIDSDNLPLIRSELDKWFSIKNANNNETNGEYKSICALLNKYEALKITGVPSSLSVLMYALIDASKSSKSNHGVLFTRGVSFANLDEKSIVSAKYIFLLNANTDKVPKKVVVNELDLRGNTANNKGLDHVFIQSQNARNNFFVSYVNKDLSKDADLYPSSFILELKKRYAVVEEITVPLDETREWCDLFTRREFKNKDYFDELLKTVEDNRTIIEIKLPEANRKVRLKDMSDFLKEPLKFKATALFGKNYDNDEDMKDEYEPFTIKNLYVSTLRKKIVKEMLKNKGSFDRNAIKQKMTLQHKLPDVNQRAGEIAFEGLMKDSTEIYERITTIPATEIIRLNDLVMDGQPQWTLICDSDVCRNVSGTQRLYFEMVIEKNKPSAAKIVEKCMYLYVASLMDIALQVEEREYDIGLVYTDFDNRLEYKLTPSLAKELLSKIYKSMQDYTDNFVLPMAQVKETKILTYSKLKDDIKNGSWKYYEDDKMFDYGNQLGYQSSSFISEFYSNIDKMKELIKPLL